MSSKATDPSFFQTRLWKTILRLIILLLSIPINAIPIALRRLSSKNALGGIKGFLESIASTLDFTFIFVAMTLLLRLELETYKCPNRNEVKSYLKFLQRATTTWGIMIIAFYIMNVMNPICFNHFRGIILSINNTILISTIILCVCAHVFQYVSD